MNNNTLSFSDIIKKKFLEDMGNLTISTTRILTVMLLSLALGLLIYFVYKKTFQGVVYNRSFNFTLIFISMVTAFIILPITSNLTLSLGMVGALSIVRFRTAVKEPIDIAYLFWAIAVGITTGAGFYSLSILGSLFISVVVVAFSFIRGSNAGFYLLVINYKSGSQNNVSKVIEKIPQKKLKTKTITDGNVEATYEIRIKNSDTSFISELSGIDGVTNAALVSYNGEC
ncbi:MAG TPA: DUF4956 domain-containing protein [Thermoclostridium sp.]